MTAVVVAITLEIDARSNMVSGVTIGESGSYVKRPNAFRATSLPLYVSATDAPGNFATRPPITTAMKASAAPAPSDRMARGVPPCDLALSPPRAPALTAVAITTPSSVIASVQCATVATGRLPSFTVAMPSNATATTRMSAVTEARRTPPAPPTPGSSRR